MHVSSLTFNNAQTGGKWFLVAVTFFHVKNVPPDVLLSPQVRLQTQPKPKPGESLLYAGTVDCFKKTLAKEVSKADLFFFTF